MIERDRAGDGAADEAEKEVARMILPMLAEARRACRNGDMGERDREQFIALLDVIEGGVCGNNEPGQNEEDAEVFKALARFRRSLRGGGLSEAERDELAVEGGFLDQIEALVVEALR